MDKLIEDELRIWAKERQLGRQMGAAAERDWLKRKGGEEKILKLFKEFNGKNSK